MYKIWKCRRSLIALFAICCLTFIGATKGTDVSMAIAGIVAAVAGSNAYEGAKKALTSDPTETQSPQ